MEAWTALGTIVAGVVAVVAAVQAREAKRSAAAAEHQAALAIAQLEQLKSGAELDRARYDWLVKNLERLRDSSAVRVPPEEVQHAVFWLQAGVLAWEPTISSAVLNVRMRRY